LLFEAFNQDNRLWIALNLADAPVVRTIDGPADILAGVATCRKAARMELTLPPHGWGILG
jgi:hypothetical protein